MNYAWQIPWTDSTRAVSGWIPIFFFIMAFNGLEYRRVVMRFCMYRHVSACYVPIHLSFVTYVLSTLYHLFLLVYTLFLPVCYLHMRRFCDLCFLSLFESFAFLTVHFLGISILRESHLLLRSMVTILQKLMRYL